MITTATFTNYKPLTGIFAKPKPVTVMSYHIVDKETFAVVLLEDKTLETVPVDDLSDVKIFAEDGIE